MVTEEQFRQLYPRASGRLLRELTQQNDDLFGEFGISASERRLHFFLAQIGHESGGGTIIEEKMNYSAKRMTQVWPKRFPTIQSAQTYAGQPQKLANKVYAGRMGNGPPASGDGWRFRGRGLIQITGRDGYESVGKRAGIDLLSQPERAFAEKDALRVACAFWSWKDLNPICDTGDFVRVTRRINGGTTGLADRKAWLDKVRRVFAKPPARSKQPDPQKVRSVQLALRKRGFVSVGPADGLLGPRTLAAIVEFRSQAGLGPGGLDETLTSVLLIG